MKRLIHLALLSLFFSGFVSAQEYYWVGGTGAWSDFDNHWATSSGGSVFHSQIPQSTDNVIFDENSFTAGGQIVNVDIQSAYCNDLTWTNTGSIVGNW